jgi:hypothetical protein
MHDRATFLSTLARDPATPEIHWTIGALVGWQARDRLEIEKTLHRHWRRFSNMPIFWFR